MYPSKFSTRRENVYHDSKRISQNIIELFPHFNEISDIKSMSYVEMDIYQRNYNSWIKNNAEWKDK